MSIYYGANYTAPYGGAAAQEVSDTGASYM